MLFAIWAVAGALPISTTTFDFIDFDAGGRQTMEIRHGLLSETEGHAGTLGGEPITLPTEPPSPPLRGSTFSPLFRARDVLDISQYPARAVAKLYRLNADATRSATACTAQFIGPNHLLTAAHCIMDPRTGAVRPGFEIDVRYDGAVADGGSARVLRAWVATEQFLLKHPIDAIVSADRCSDYAVLEIAEPLGAETGWLAMREQLPSEESGEKRVMHRFSYPHQNPGDVLANSARNESLSEDVRKQLEEAIADVRRNAAEFSPDNLYFDYGIPDEAQGLYIAHSGSSAPGRSGSALLDERGAITAILSRSYSGMTYSCRITAGDIAAISAIRGF